MSNNSTRRVLHGRLCRGCGVGFVGLLTIVFIALKLANFIDWLWWWVLSPLLIVCGVLLLALFVFAVRR